MRYLQSFLNRRSVQPLTLMGKPAAQGGMVDISDFSRLDSSHIVDVALDHDLIVDMKDDAQPCRFN